MASSSYPKEKRSPLHLTPAFTGLHYVCRLPQTESASFS